MNAQKFNHQIQDQIEKFILDRERECTLPIVDNSNKAVQINDELNKLDLELMEK